MFFHGPVKKTVSVFFRFFEDRAPGVQERSQGRDERKQFVVGLKALQQGTAVIDRVEDRLERSASAGRS